MLRNLMNLLCEPSIKIPAGQIQNIGAQFYLILTVITDNMTLSAD